MERGRALVAGSLVYLPGPTLVAIMNRHLARTSDSCSEGKVLSPKSKQHVGRGAGDCRQEQGGMSGGASAGLNRGECSSHMVCS